MIKQFIIFCSIFCLAFGQIPFFTNFDYNCPKNVLQTDYCPSLFSNISIDHFNDLLRPVRYANKETIMNTSQIIENRGYKYETYEISTEDGYILRIFRIIPINGIPGVKGPILMQHGVFRNSDCFFEAKIETSTPEALVEAGYDIWLGNNRGSRYSQKTSSNFTGHNYWDFCWHEMGIYDDAAMIDFILDKTGYRKMGYIGHSQGTTHILVLLSEKKEYNEKLSLVAMLAPVAYVTHMSGLFGTLGTFFGTSNAFASVRIMLGIPPKIQSTISNVVPEFCQSNSLNQALCAATTFSYLGLKPCYTNCATLAFILGHYPDAVPSKSFWHFSQEKISSNFAVYDHRVFTPETPEIQFIISNLMPRAPPRNYTLSNISTNFVIFHSDSDQLSTLPDVLRLIGDLGDKVKAIYRYPNYSHSEFLHSLDIIEKINNPLILHFGEYPPIKV